MSIAQAKGAFQALSATNRVMLYYYLYVNYFSTCSGKLMDM